MVEGIQLKFTVIKNKGLGCREQGTVKYELTLENYHYDNQKIESYQLAVLNMQARIGNIPLKFVN